MLQHHRCQSSNAKAQTPGTHPQGLMRDTEDAYVD